MLRRKRECSVFAAVTFNESTTEKMLSGVLGIVLTHIKKKNGLTFSHSSANARKLRALQPVNHLNFCSQSFSSYKSSPRERLPSSLLKMQQVLKETQRGVYFYDDRLLSDHAPPVSICYHTSTVVDRWCRWVRHHLQNALSKVRRKYASRWNSSTVSQILEKRIYFCNSLWSLMGVLWLAALAFHQM